MSRTSETQVEQVSIHRTKCPQPCNKTILVNGKFKCARKGCGKEYTLAELYADLLLGDAITPREFEMQLDRALPNEVEASQHKRAHELFGDRFIGIPNNRSLYRAGEPWRSNMPTLNGAHYREYLRFGYRWETLEECARAGWWLVVGLPPLQKFFGTWKKCPGIGQCVLCDCGGDNRWTVEVGLLPFWLLVKPLEQLLNVETYLSQQNIALKHLTYRVATPLEVIYFAQRLELLGKNSFDVLSGITRIDYWCGETGMNEMLLRYCSEHRKLFVVDGRIKRNALDAAHRSDKEVLYLALAVRRPDRY